MSALEASITVAAHGTRRLWGLSLYLIPGVDPVVVVHARVAARVSTVRGRRLPVVHALPECWLSCVVLVAELGIRRVLDHLGGGDQRGRAAGQGLGRGLTEGLS